MRQIIKNGTIVTGSGSFPADILIDGEKIAATGTAEEIKKLAQPGDKEIDASGCLISLDLLMHIPISTACGRNCNSR